MAGNRVLHRVTRHLVDFPPLTVAINRCAGPADVQGQGQRLGHRTATVRRGAPQVPIDPDPENERAVRAYRRAGLHDVALRADGAGDIALVMRFAPYTLV